MTKIHLQAAVRLQREVTELEKELKKKRKWVGLTAEDMADAHNSTSGDVMMRLAGFARAIEAKLREKNT
jgi:DNA-directed RNA polymerase specialized sigma24 family protein